VRSLRIAIVATVVITGLTASPALAAKGWKLPKLHQNLSGLDVTGSAKHCGKSKFGTWTFTGTMKAEGKVAHTKFKAKVTRNGAAHKVTHVSVTGDAPASAIQAIKQVIATEKLRYVAGSTPKLETLSNGQRFAIRTFKPKRTKHC